MVTTDSNRDKTPASTPARGKRTALDLVKKTFQMVSVIQDIQTNHSVMLTEILQRLRNKGILVSRPDGMPEIPLVTVNDAESMEQPLASAACAEYLAKVLSNKSGATPIECVDRIMKKLMKRNVGSLYTFKGRAHKGKTQKLSFSSSRMYLPVKEAVLLVHSSANGKEIDTTIMDFLRYSPFRGRN